MGLIDSIGGLWGGGPTREEVDQALLRDIQMRHAQSDMVNLQWVNGKLAYLSGKIAALE